MVINGTAVGSNVGSKRRAGYCIDVKDAEIALGGGDYDGDYYTKYAQYGFTCRQGNSLDPYHCDNTTWLIEKYWDNGKVTANRCYTMDTDIGRTICKGLKSQGFEYNDQEY